MTFPVDFFQCPHTHGMEDIQCCSSSRTRTGHPWRIAVGLRFAIGPLVPFLFGSWFGASQCNRVPTWRMPGWFVGFVGRLDAASTLRQATMQQDWKNSR